MIYKMSTRKKLHGLLLAILIALTVIPVLAWTVSPVRFEIKAEKGKEYTFTFAVLNESQLYQKRFEIQMDDWIINKNNEFLRKAFTKGVENKYSATSWIKVTPVQFVVPPGETKTIRFTVSVPKELPSDGDYSAGIFVGEKNIEKPLKGEKIVHIKQDTFIGVVVYVQVGQENPKTTLKALKIESNPRQGGKSKVKVFPTFINLGNIHSRGQIQLKVEPAQLPNTTDNNTLIKEVSAGEVVILRESEVTFPIDVPDLLPNNSEWRFTLKTDLGDYEPVLVGTKKYKVPEEKIMENGKMGEMKNKSTDEKQGIGKKEIKKI